MFNLQKMILVLLNFWQKQGCILHQGHDLELGAGTFNPATFLRALGPEPYRTVYIEPSRRPQDGRYGIHPNRLQNYHQLQVLLKPAPHNMQDLFLASLEEIGLNLVEHDIRFVHDDWENPTIGASGLGWEVWLNGMEITQLTYFQNVGSQPLAVVSAEITYGIERIAMYLQKKESIFDIMWNDSLTYGDVVKSSEFEWSRYNFEEANVDMWIKHFEDFSREAVSLLKKSLPIAAYDFVIKASHAFNILDSRGVISVTERTGYITRIRQLAKQVAEKHLESRQSQNFPLLNKSEHSPSEDPPEDVLTNTLLADNHPTNPEIFLLEIGSEELPASFVPRGIESLNLLIEKFLKEERLDFSEVRVFGTPRRITCLIYGLSHKKDTSEIKIKKGPLLSHVFLDDDSVSQSGKQFFESLNINLSSLEEISKFPQLSVKEIKGSQYIFISATRKSLPIQDLLLEKIPNIISNMTFPKKMRWDDSKIEYARPIRWLVALYGKQIIPIQIARVMASRISQGHRQLSPGTCIISSPETYIDDLMKHSVIVDQEIRRNMILDGLNLIREVNNLHPAAQHRLIEETTFLSEHPFVVIGSFPERFTSLPKELLMAEMVEHQKYFPLTHECGKISNNFAIVIDNHPNDFIIQGNQRALRPRLTDGDFLFKQDLKQSLESFSEKLSSVRFMENLGSLKDKVERITTNATIFCKNCGIIKKDALTPAIKFCKADLVSAVVNEFPELQGLMGYYYTLAGGYSAEVALAIKEHLSHPQIGTFVSENGVILSIADRIDNIVSCFCNKFKPSSSHDPYALRRQTLEILTLIINSRLDLNFSIFLEECLKNFLKQFKIQSPEQVIPKLRDLHDEILSFTNGRFTTILKNLGYKDELLAVTSKLSDFNYYQFLQRASKLHEFKNHHNDAYGKITHTYKRLKKLLPENPHNIDQAMAVGEHLSQLEKALIKEINQELAKKEERNQEFEFLLNLSRILNRFLDEVKIFDNHKESESIRINILQRCIHRFNHQYNFEYV